MSNSNIEDYKCHEYIVKRVKETLTDSYSYSYSLVLFDILEIDAFDEIFYELISDYELLENKLSNLNQISIIMRDLKSKNNIDYDKFKKIIKSIRKPINNSINDKRARLNELVRLFAKMAIGFEFAHPVEMKEREDNKKYNYDSLINPQFTNPKIKKDDIESIDITSTTHSIEEKTKSLVNDIHNGIEGTIFSDDFRNNLISILTKNNFKSGKHYNGVLKKVLKVIEVIVNKNMNYNVFDSLNSENKFYLDTEHIIPRSLNGGDNEDRREIWKLGNASLLESFINRPMGDPDFKCKRDGCYNKSSKHKECDEATRKDGTNELCYRDSSIKMNHDLLEYDIFTKDEINDRTEKLANLIVEIVFSNKYDKDFNDKNHKKS